MTNEEIIEKINEILAKVHDVFNQANTHAMRDFENATDKDKYKQDRHGLRNWWLDKYRENRKNKQINMFSFNADDIIELKIPSKVVGCSGRADLFAKYANEMDLDVNIVVMVRTDEKDKDMPNGHQIIAVKFPDGRQQLIDPGLAENYQAAKVNGNCALGTEIIIPGQPKYEIRAILTPDTHAKIDSQEKLTKIYKNPQIKPETQEILTAANTIVNELQNPKTGLNSLEANIIKSLNKEELVQLNEDIKNKIKRQETKPLQYIKIILQHFIIEKIQQNEVARAKSAVEAKSPEQFKLDIPNGTKKYLATIKDLSKENLETIIDNHNNLRESLNGEPKIFMEYGFSTSCSNAATAFIHEFGEKYEEFKPKLMFLDTTRWDSLLDGRAGHVVPCIKLDSEDWIMIEPLHETIDVGISTKIIPKDDFGEDKPLEHLMAHRKGEPYMITAISAKPCTDHEKWLKHTSSVSLGRAQMFIKQMGEQGYLSAEQCTKLQTEFAAERERRIKSLRLATEELGKQVKRGPYVSMDELKKAQAQQAYLGYANLHE